MTVSHTNHKSTSTKSHHSTPAAADAKHATSHPEVTTAEAPTATSPQPASPSSSSVTEAIAQLDALEAKLNLNIVIPPNDKNQYRRLQAVTDTAIGLAADVVSSDPARFADFATLPASAQYVNTLGPLAQRAATFATHLNNSVQNERSPAATQTLALYSVVKGLGRITSNETMREKVELLRTEIAPKRKNPKPKQTKSEKTAKRASKALAKKIDKAQKLLAANGVTVAPSSSPPSSSTPVPSASPPEATPPAQPTPVPSTPPASH